MTVATILCLASGGLAVATSGDAGFRRCDPPAAGEAWPTATPEEVGLDPVVLQQAVTYATVHQSATFQVVRFGCLVASSILDPVFGHVKRNLWSHTKTLVALLVGRAETLGYLTLDDTVGRWFPEADAAHASISVRHLLTMTSGLHTEWVNELDLLQPDRVRSALTLPVDHEPGTYFDYNQTAVTLLAALVQRAVGRDLQEFAQAELFDHIGIERSSWFWVRDRSGNTEGWALWFAEPNDTLARLGTLMLQDGAWAGYQVIDPRFMSELRTPTATNPGYGYLTWVNAGPWYWTPGFPARERRDHRPIQSARRPTSTCRGGSTASTP